MPLQPVSSRGWNARAALLDAVDEEVFQQEQEMIATRCWTALGLAADLQRPGDWITGRLGRWEVCIQNFGATIRGFRNYCAHRFFPLRTGPKGNGPLRCPFHGWSYDETGRAIDIPLAEEMFGCPGDELNRRLRPVEVAIRGPLVFARLPSPAASDLPDLDPYLDDIAPFLSALTSPHFQLTPMGVVQNTINANWKTCYKLALDDYHIVEVHPRTFGRHGHLPKKAFIYKHIDRHACLFAINSDRVRAPVSEAMYHEVLADLSRGVLPANHNFIFGVFPSVIVSLTSGVVSINKLLPVSAAETRQDCWVFRITPRE
jgi:phenylpropionate dioxygenase-like ring-hydroxylating dioxygenase large terminal subunit